MGNGKSVKSVIQPRTESRNHQSKQLKVKRGVDVVRSEETHFLICTHSSDLFEIMISAEQAPLWLVGCRVRSGERSKVLNMSLEQSTLCLTTYSSEARAIRLTCACGSDRKPNTSNSWSVCCFEVMLSTCLRSEEAEQASNDRLTSF